MADLAAEIISNRLILGNLPVVTQEQNKIPETSSFAPKKHFKGLERRKSVFCFVVRCRYALNGSERVSKTLRKRELEGNFGH